MIHLIIGTKAQLIKMAPIIRELEARQEPYNFIDAGQHAGLTGKIIEQLDLPQPNVYLRNSEENITTLFQAIKWLVQIFFQLIFKKKEIYKNIFHQQPGICLIHGDTLTTLISLFYAKRCGIQVAHVEAGLRSYRLFDPFPEEIIRLIAMRFSDILFAPSEWAVGNLEKMGHRGKTIFINGNTGMDTVAYAKDHLGVNNLPSTPYIVTTIHRVETIYSRTRLEMIINLLEQIAKTHTVLFVLHEPTQNQLEKFGLDNKLQQIPKLQLLPLQPYLAFIGLLSKADFIITDGGSIQEESYFLNIPCLIMRSSTERMEGINSNAFLAQFDEERIARFFSDLPKLKQSSAIQTAQPSKKIVDYITHRQS
jgi:UDP-N-acetylglucosamine 2-epimerase